MMRFLNQECVLERLALAFALPEFVKPQDHRFCQKHLVHVGQRVQLKNY